MALPRKIEFTGGFTITPNNGYNPPVGPGDYYLVNQYRDAHNDGEIIIPLHTTNPGNGGLDFNDVNENTGDAIYINLYDSIGTNNSAYLLNLVGNHTRLTFRQNSYHVTFDCTNQAWQTGGYSGNQVYHDPSMESAPQNSINIISTSGVTFNDVDPITITIAII